MHTCAAEQSLKKNILLQVLVFLRDEKSHKQIFIFPKKKCIGLLNK